MFVTAIKLDTAAMTSVLLFRWVSSLAFSLMSAVLV
jgi:hypothetical protein